MKILHHKKRLAALSIISVTFLSAAFYILNSSDALMHKGMLVIMLIILCFQSISGIIGTKVFYGYKFADKEKSYIEWQIGRASNFVILSLFILGLVYRGAL